VTEKYFEFGTAYHAAMETYYDPDTWTYDRQVIAARATLVFADVCEAQKSYALKVRDELYMEDDVELDYAERVELGKGMLNYYFTKVAPEEDIGWRPLKVEIAFMIPIPNPETGEAVIWCKCDACLERWDAHIEKMSTGQVPVQEMRWEGLPVVYAGRIDMLAEDKRGHYWIFDWKTAAQIREDDEYLYLDDQISSYTWAMRFLGLPVRGFVYHAQRKAYPVPPTKNKVVRLGRQFSVNQNQATSYPIFLETVQREDPIAYEEGLYDEFLEFLRNEGTVFFKRHQIPKTAYEIAEIERNIGLEALDMINPKLRIYPAAGRFSCGSCAFRQPCLGQNAGEDYQYTLDTLFEKREPYYLRARPSTESKGGM